MSGGPKLGRAQSIANIRRSEREALSGIEHLRLALQLGGFSQSELLFRLSAAERSLKEIADAATAELDGARQAQFSEGSAQ